MKNLITLALAAMSSLTAMAQDVAYTLNGSVPDSVKTVSISINGAKPSDVAAAAGKFSAKGTAPKDAIISVMMGRMYRLSAVNDGTPVNIDFNAKTVTGSKVNNSFGEMQQADMKADEAMMQIYNRYMELRKKGTDDVKPEMEKLMGELNAMQQKQMADVVAYCKEHKNDVSPAYYLAQICQGLEYDDLDALLDKSAAYYNHPVTEFAKKQLQSMELRRPGRMFADLTMNDPEGKTHKLSEWAGKGNYVLVDFWASWCGPCRAEMPNVVETYNKYHAKGYDVVGVSFDSKADAWKNAIKSLNMPWHHISDLKGWQCAAADAYGISGIPSNVLLDPQGKIVAADLRGEALKEKLKEIYGF